MWRSTQGACLYSTAQVCVYFGTSAVRCGNSSNVWQPYLNVTDRPDLWQQGGHKAAALSLTRPLLHVLPAGGDATEGFHGPQHPPTVHELIKDYCIGTLKDQ